MQGSLAQQSSREKPQTLRPEVQDKLPVLDGHAITDDRVVENTFINQTAVNEDAFRERMDLVAGFPEGRIIIVTYFSQNKPITDMMSAVVDMTSTAKDDVHIAWTQIRNFELRCSNDMSFEYDEDSNKSSIKGEAVVFPRFTPRVSDIFLYELRNGKIGVFRVTAVRRLAVGQDTYHSINFTMQEFLTAPTRDLLQKQSTRIAYFDKQKFLVGNTSMLTTDGFQQKKELEHIRLEIIENYVERFYDTEYSTFIRPDKIYDPYIVEYWNKKVSIQDTTPHIRPTQILISVSNYRKTIWAVLTNNPIKNLNNVERTWNIETYHSTFWGVNITSLLGRKFITVGDEADSNNNYSINHKGEPILLDPLPMFHKKLPEEVIDRHIDRDFHRAVKEFYWKFPEARHGRMKPIEKKPHKFPFQKEAKTNEITGEKAHYALSLNFYNGSSAMDPFEHIVYDLVTNKEVDPSKAIEAVSRYQEWSDEDAFYREMFALYIIDKTLYWLMYH